MKTGLELLPLFARGLSLLLWMVVIFIFSSLPGSGSPVEFTPLFYLERKGAHVMEYAVLMLLAIRFTFLIFPRESLKRILLLAGVFSIAYAASDELHQFFIPYREAKASDVLIDGLGIILAGALVRMAAYMRHRG